MHQHRLPLLQTPAELQREVRRVVVEHEARPLGEVKGVGQLEAEELGCHRNLGEGAKHAEPRHPISGTHGRTVGSRAHQAPDLAAGNEGQRWLDPVLTPGLQDLRERHPGGVDFHHDAASRSEHVRGLGLRNLDQTERLGGGR